MPRYTFQIRGGNALCGFELELALSADCYETAHAAALHKGRRTAELAGVPVASLTVTELEALGAPCGGS